MSEDPIRLFEDDRLPGQLRDDLRAAGGTSDPSYDVDAGLARFSALVAGGAAGAGAGGAAGASGAAAKGTTAALAAKIAAGLAVIGLVGAGVALRPGAAPEEAPIASSAPVAIAAPSAPAPREEPAKPAEPPAPAPVTATASAPPAPSAARSAPRAEAGRSLKDEMDHMAALREIARTDPARAAAMADEGHARFPRGVFWQEREVLAITSLAAAGRGAEARARASAFLERHPESPFAEALRRAAGMDR